jgi:hypothetical protein
MKQREYILDGQRLLEANLDFQREIERKGVCLAYSAAMDTLFIQFGGPTEALSEYVTDNVILRIEPDTLKIAAIEVLDFMGDFLPNNRLFQGIAEEFGIRPGQDFEENLTGPKLKVYREALGSLAPWLAQAVAHNAK